MILLLKLRIRESAFSIAPRLVVQTSGVRLCKFPLAHTHPYFISVRHSCIYPMFLLAVLFVLQGKRKMTPIIPALTALTHNIVWLTPCFLLLSQRVKTRKARPYKTRNPTSVVHHLCWKSVIYCLA